MGIGTAYNPSKRMPLGAVSYLLSLLAFFGWVVSMAVFWNNVAIIGWGLLIVPCCFLLTWFFNTHCPQLADICLPDWTGFALVGAIGLIALPTLPLIFYRSFDSDFWGMILIGGLLLIVLSVGWCVSKVAKHFKDKSENKPKIAFRSEELTALARECASRFVPALKKIPKVYISPEEDFDDTMAFYIPAINEAFFSAAYLKRASPEQLKNTMLHELLHAWIHQHKYDDALGHDGAFKAAATMFGID